MAIQILELLSSQPSPEVILAISPTSALQIRISERLDRHNSIDTIYLKKKLKYTAIGSISV